jgi:hypothetical protein
MVIRLVVHVCLSQHCVSMQVSINFYFGFYLVSIAIEYYASSLARLTMDFICYFTHWYVHESIKTKCSTARCSHALNVRKVVASYSLTSSIIDFNRINISDVSKHASFIIKARNEERREFNQSTTITNEHIHEIRFV